MTDTSINAFNLKIRTTDWYQNWFRERGLDPNMVKLNDQQRQELKQLVEAKSGFVLPGDMKIDPAGNLNEKGGWAGLPVGVKIAIIGAATIATAGAAGAFASGGGIGAGGMGAGANAAAAGNAAHVAGGGLMMGAGGTASSVLGGTAALGGTTAATGAGLFSTIAKNRGGLLSGAGRMISQAGQASATNRGVELDARLEHDQLGLQADRERRYAETDAYRKSLYGQLAAGYQPSQRPAGAEGRHTEGFVTPQAREAGQLMTDIAMQRMKTNDYPGITPFSQLPVKPGVMERISQFAAPALGLFDPELYYGKQSR